MPDDRPMELIPFSLPADSADTLRTALDDGELDSLTVADLLDDEGEKALVDYLAYVEDTGETPVSIHTSFLDWLIDRRRSEDVAAEFDTLAEGDAVEFTLYGSSATHTGTVSEVVDATGQGGAVQAEAIVTTDDVDDAEWPQYGLTRSSEPSVDASGLDDEGGERLGTVTKLRTGEAQ